MITGRNREKVAAVAAELRTVGIMLDLRSADSIRSGVVEVMQRFGRIDIVIFSAGIWHQGSLQEHAPEQIQDLFAVNTVGTILLTREVIPVMQAQKKGRLIYVLSRDAKTTKKSRSVYHASKWGLEGFVRCLRHDLAGESITVTGIYPGVMQTQLFTKAGAQRDTSDALLPQAVAAEIEHILTAPEDVVITSVSLQHRSDPVVP